MANAMLPPDNDGIPLVKTRSTANNNTTMIFIKRTWYGVGDTRKLDWLYIS